MSMIAFLAVARHTHLSGQTGVDATMLGRVPAVWSTMDVEKAAPFCAKDPALMF